MKHDSARNIAVTGIGTVLFFLLGRFVSVPSPVETVDICVQYGLLAFLSVVYGPLVGVLTGFAGHLLIDLSVGAPCWSWILASAAFGGLLGVLSNVLNLNAAAPDRDHLIRFNLCQVAVHVVCWAGIAPVLEIVFYGESIDRIFEQGLTAGAANAVTTAIVASLLLTAYSALHSRHSSAPES